MNLDDKYICVFVRQNMFPDHQMVHSFHLGLLIGKALDGYCQKRHELTGHPNVLVFGEPDEAGVIARAGQLRQMGIEVVEWRDPDANPEHGDFGLTGIVTEPINKTLRNKLPRFKQWSANNNVHPHNSPPAEASTAVALDGQRGANSEGLRSSEKEHSTFSREVAGSIPAASSNLNCS